MSKRFSFVFCVAIAFFANVWSIETITEITKENFREKIMTSKKPIILNFYGDHCPSCHFLEPIFAGLSEQYGQEILFAKVNAATERGLSAQFKIRAVPTMIFLRCEGSSLKIIKTKVGFRDRQDIEYEVIQLLPENR